MAVSSLLDAVGNLLVLAAAIVLVVRRGRDNLGSIIDTTIAAIALGGVLWDVVLRPNLSVDYQAGPAKVAVCVVIFALSGVLGALVRLVIQSPAGSVAPLIIALVLALVANIIFAATTASLPLTVAGMMFVGAYTCVGLFSLATQSLRLMVPGSAGPDSLSMGRLLFLGLAVAIVPIVVGARMLVGDGRDGLVLIVSSIATTALVMVRIGQLSAQRDRAVQALKHEATHDPLTGLVNRKEFVHQLDAMLAASQRSVIMFCDLDRFKAVNDRFGHAQGDQVLVEIARRLRGAVPSDDVVGRFGGDEFVVLSPHTSDEDVQRTCRRIVDVLSRPLVIAGEQVTVGVTIGTTIATDGVDPEALIARADQAMYAAKDRDPWS